MRAMSVLHMGVLDGSMVDEKYGEVVPIFRIAYAERGSRLRCFCTGLAPFIAS